VDTCLGQLFVMMCQRERARHHAYKDDIARLILQRYLARITRSDRQAKGHPAAKLTGCTPASRSLARPQETSNVVVLS